MPQKSILHACAPGVAPRRVNFDMIGEKLPLTKSRRACSGLMGILKNPFVLTGIPAGVWKLPEVADRRAEYGRMPIADSWDHNQEYVDGYPQ